MYTFLSAFPILTAPVSEKVGKRGRKETLGKYSYYMEKLGISVHAKSNGSRHSVCKATENMGSYDTRRYHFVLFLVCSADLDVIESVTGRSSIMSNFTVLCSCTRFPLGWFV